MAPEIILFVRLLYYKAKKRHTKRKNPEIIQSVGRIQVSLKAYMNYATPEITQYLGPIRKSPNKRP